MTLSGNSTSNQLHDALTKALATWQAIFKKGNKRDFVLTPAVKSKQSGLEDRYTVHRKHDTDGKHAECEYFVLDLTHDPIARRSLLAYASTAQAEEFEALSRDLFTTVERIEKQA